MNIENSISKNLTITENGLVAIHRIKKPDSNRVRIKQSEVARKMKEGFYDNKPSDFLDEIKVQSSSDGEDKHKKKSKKKKKHKKDKKAKKLKKQKKKNVKMYSDQLDTSSRKPNIGMILAKILKNHIDIRVVKNQVYLYDNKTGMFKLSDKQEITTKINYWIEHEREDSFKFTSRDTDEAYKHLITDQSIQRESMDGAYNKPYILCRNGVLELPSLKLLPFSSDYEFTSRINACYDENAKGDNFKEFIEYATNGNKAHKHQIQEVYGYGLSNYSFKRLCFVFKGIKGSGKSTALDVLRGLVGEETTCEVPLDQMRREYYAATILSSKLNIVPDHNTNVITDVSRFKSFVSDADVVTGRNPCEKPFAKRCRTKMFIGQNDFFRFSGVGQNDLDAFFDRIFYIAFDRALEKRIDGFWELLVLEYDYIFSYAMKGLKRLMENGFVFTKCEESEKMKIEAMAQCCPEEVFYNQCLKSAEGRYESSTSIAAAFRYFCNKNNIEGNFNITSYLEKKNIPKLRKRINEGGYISSEGNPIYVYEGIRLRTKCRVS